MISSQVLCHVVDLKHGFVTSWENVLFTLENIGLNYLELFPLPHSTHGKNFHRLCARFGAILLLIFTSMISILHCDERRQSC